MADVKIVDIDGEQWNMKDQEARTRIAVLEEKTVITEKVLWERQTEYIKIVTINDKRFLDFNFDGIVEASQVVQTQIQLGSELDPATTINVTGNGDYKNGSGRIPITLSFSTNGNFSTIAILPTQTSGAINTVSVFGHGFVNMD